MWRAEGGRATCESVARRKRVTREFVVLMLREMGTNPITRALCHNAEQRGRIRPRLAWMACTLDSLRRAGVVEVVEYSRFWGSPTRPAPRWRLA